jgi:CysZ protein
MIEITGYLWKALKLLKTPVLRPFLLIPFLINIILYTIAFILGYVYLDHWITQAIPAWLFWLRWLIYPLFFVSFCTVGFFSFTLLANVIAAPFYAKLAAKTLTLINAPVLATHEPTLREIWQAEFKRLSYVLMRTLPLLLLFVIPVVNIAAPIVWFLFSAWCVALEYFAFPLENQGILFPQQKEKLNTMKLSALSFGSFITLGLSIPFINVIVAPVAIIAATLYTQAHTQPK